MERKLIYLVNPISGTGKKSVLKQKIIKRTTAAGFPFEIIDTRSDGDYSELRNRILNENITDVIICGGDGSVSTVTSHLLDMNVAIGIIPMGSGNGLALAAGIPPSVNKALDIIFKGYSSFIDGYLINNKFSCMMCGIGSDAQIAHDFAVQKKRGLKTYLRISALQYFKIRSFSFTVQTQQSEFPANAFFITVANGNQFGNYVTIAPKASLHDGLLDIVIVKKMHKLMLPFWLLHQIAGINTLAEIKNYRNSKNIVYFQASELTVINHELAPIHIDGEPQPVSEKIEFRILPDAFRLLQPFSQPVAGL